MPSDIICQSSARACPHLGDSGAAKSSIHRGSADLELTDATLWHARRSMGAYPGPAAWTRDSGTDWLGVEAGPIPASHGVVRWRLVTEKGWRSRTRDSIGRDLAGCHTRSMPWSCSFRRGGTCLSAPTILPTSARCAAAQVAGTEPVSRDYDQYIPGFASGIEILDHSFVPRTRSSTSAEHPAASTCETGSMGEVTALWYKLTPMRSTFTYHSDAPSVPDSKNGWSLPGGEAVVKRLSQELNCRHPAALWLTGTHSGLRIVFPWCKSLALLWQIMLTASLLDCQIGQW